MTGNVWEWRQRLQLEKTSLPRGSSPLWRCAASTRSITLYLRASDTKNAPKVTFKERGAAGGDGLNKNVSHRRCPVSIQACSDCCHVAWHCCSHITISLNYNCLTQTICVYKAPTQAGKKDKTSLELLQQMDDRNISQYQLKIRERLCSLEMLTSRWR